jgi:aryl-alcohol dehydrogenase-like predicted oxidoreductase
MERRTLGKTGLSVSALGFGCGDVGGLMVRGTPADQERGVARAIELGINYFDTAAAYGRGESEKNLGRVLRTLRPDIVLGTKFRVDPEDRGRVAEAVTASLEASLGRLGLERVDLFQLHNRVSETGQDRPISPADVLDQVVPALERLRSQGKIGFFGITALGEAPALHRVIDARVLYTAQVCYNLLNPSAGVPVPAGYPAQDFARLLDHTRAADMGVIAIRVLAAGALSGAEARHPVAIPTVAPIASGADYAADVARARRLEALVREGHAESLVEAAIRFAISNPAVSTALVGYSSLEHLEYAAAAADRGPLSRAALDRLTALWQEAA